MIQSNKDYHLTVKLLGYAKQFNLFTILIMKSDYKINLYICLSCYKPDSILREYFIKTNRKGFNVGYIRKFHIREMIHI